MIAFGCTRDPVLTPALESASLGPLGIGSAGTLYLSGAHPNRL